MKLVFACFCLWLWAGTATGHQESTPRLSPSYPIPIFRSAKELLAHGRAMKLKRHGASKEAREQWGLRAVDAYRAVRARFPHETRYVQEAFFRSGRLLVVMGREDAALADFFCVTDLQSQFGLRARMEMAHVHRRSLRWRLAADLYSFVASAAEADTKQRANAQLSLGDISLQMGDSRGAKQAWLAVINSNCDRRKHVLAFDRLSRMHVGEDVYKELSVILLTCLDQLGEVLLEESDEGARLRRTLVRTQLVKRLAMHAK